MLFWPCLTSLFLPPGPCPAPRAAPCGQRARVCPLSGVPRHLQILRHHSGQTQTGGSPCITQTHWLKTLHTRHLHTPVENLAYTSLAHTSWKPCIHITCTHQLKTLHTHHLHPLVELTHMHVLWLKCTESRETHYRHTHTFPGFLQILFQQCAFRCKSIHTLVRLRKGKILEKGYIWHLLSLASSCQTCAAVN